MVERHVFHRCRQKEARREYYNSLFELYESWGVDFIKVDDLSRPYHKDEIEMIRHDAHRSIADDVRSYQDTSPGRDAD